MTNKLMPSAQRSDDDAVWVLPRGSSTTLAAHAHRRVVQVCEGLLWATTQGRDGYAALDVWLTAGETLTLEPGTDIVLEGWPSARYRVLVPSLAAEARPHWTDRIVRMMARLRPSRRSPLLAGA